MGVLSKAVAAVVLIFAAVAWATAAGVGGNAGAMSPAVLPRPHPGTTVATTLPDGAPVFVVGHADGGVSVLSAIDTHLQDLVVFCPDSRTFIEPGPVSRWDEYGRYLFGPAPGGLAPYEVTLDGDAVRVGRRLEPPPRTVDAVPVVERGKCVELEGFGGIRHRDGDLPPVVGAAGPGRLGTFVRVRGLLDLPADGPPRLCPPAPGATACPNDAPEVTSTFFDRGLVTGMVGNVEGTFLVRPTVTGFAELAGPLRTATPWEGLRPRDPAPPPPDITVTGRLVAVEDISRQGTAEIVMADVLRSEQGTSQRLRGTSRFSLSANGQIQLNDPGNPGPGFITPQEAAALLASGRGYDGWADFDHSGQIVYLAVEPSAGSP